jgi:ABC-type multidrug transport system ATPase subunit
MSTPLLHVDGLHKRYRRGLWHRETTFSLSADLLVEDASVIAIMGANGSGKTTLFELITGTTAPSSGRVLVSGHDIHRVRYDERDRLAIHYHQSYQVRSMRRRVPSFTLRPAAGTRPRVHLFDEPEFNTQDGYIGFMLEFFQRLKREGRVVFLCLHPNEHYHLEILRASCERFLFIHEGRLIESPTLDALLADARLRPYLGALASD